MTGPAREVAATRGAVRRALADRSAGELVLVACSGGADSLALVVAALHVGQRAGLRVGGVTVDHGLQSGSGARAVGVANVMRARGCDPVEVVTVAVGSVGGPEAAARSARYSALDDVVRRTGASCVLLGHTREDQAETVLLGLARGSGSRSLAGMAAVNGHYRRPFLQLARAEVRAAADAAGLEAWEDPHNHDPAYARSRVRHELLPVLDQTLGPGAVAALARSADLLRADADALDEWSLRVLPEVVVKDGALDVDRLSVLPTAIRTRVIRRVAVEAGCPPGSLTSGHIRAVDALVMAWTGQGTVALPGAVCARRDCGRLHLARTDT